MKTFFSTLLFVAFSLVVADASSMGFPTNVLANRKASSKLSEDPKHKQRKAAEQFKKTNAAKWTAIAEPNVKELLASTQDYNISQSSAVGKMSNVMVRVLDADGSVLREKEMPKSQLLAGGESSLLRNSRFVALLEGIAYYISLGKEAL